MKNLCYIQDESSNIGTNKWYEHYDLSARLRWKHRNIVTPYTDIWNNNLFTVKTPSSARNGNSEFIISII